MKFDKIIPTCRLKPFVKYLAIAEQPDAHTYKVFPPAGPVIGFQYKGQLTSLKDNAENSLAKAGITGLSDRYQTFRSSPGIGTVLVHFTETGISHFSPIPACKFFNRHVSLHDVFGRHAIAETEEKLAGAGTDLRRIEVVERFLLAELTDRQADRLIAAAVEMIYQSAGTIKMKALSERLFISQSPLEKRFGKLVGTSPKKFASIVRFNAVMHSLSAGKPLSGLCYEYNFFDQAHFIKDFKQYTGDTPEHFKRFL